MVINREFLFIHIPKTGGTSCTDYLCQTLKGPVYCSSIKSQHADHHFNATLFSGYSHETLEEIYDDRERILRITGVDPTTLRNVIAVVRHPYALELSNYLFFRNGRKNILKGAAFQVAHVQSKVELAQNSFAHFVQHSGYFREELNGVKFRTEDYITLDGEVPEFLTVLKSETLGSTFPDLTRPYRDRDDIPFPHSNKSRMEGDMQLEDIDEETKRVIQVKHAWVFDNGYYER